MWMLHSSRLSIIATFALIVFQKAFAPPNPKDKVPLELDIFEAPPRRVEAVSSKEVPGGTNYSVKPSSRHTHIIGDVIDTGELLHRRDTKAVSKDVFVLTDKDGLKYVRVFTKRRDNITFTRAIEEFIKVPGDHSYRRVFRASIDIDILTQESDRHVNVEVLMPSDSEIEAMRTAVDGVPILPSHYSIRPKYRFYATIGVVKYAHYIVEDRVEGLTERTVVWGGKVGRPVITITSRYKNGNEIKSTYALLGTERRNFYCCDEKKRFVNSRV